MTRYELTSGTAKALINILDEAQGTDTEFRMLLIFSHLEHYAELYPSTPPDPSLSDTFAALTEALKPWQELK